MVSLSYLETSFGQRLFKSPTEQSGGSLKKKNKNSILSDVSRWHLTLEWKGCQHNFNASFSLVF